MDSMANVANPSDPFTTTGQSQLFWEKKCLYFDRTGTFVSKVQRAKYRILHSNTGTIWFRSLSLGLFRNFSKFRK